MYLLRLTVLVVLSLLIAPPASADKEKAKEHFKKGMTQYKLDHFDEAIASFEAAYSEEPSPVFLYNIAQAHRLARRPREALTFYRKYLKEAPDAKNKDQVDEQVVALEQEVKRLEAEEKKAEEEAAAARAREEAERAIAQPSPPPSAPKKRWPLWVGIGAGAGALVLIGGITAGVLANQSDPSLGLENAR